MGALAKRTGPTRLWKTLRGKKVKTNDAKKLGEIKEISDNYIHIKKGIIHKESFWIPKYVADAFDGKILWLLLSEEEVRGRYQYGTEPPAKTKKGRKEEEYTSEFERFKQTIHGQKINYRPDFNENIRVVENYNNIRDLQNSNVSTNDKRKDSETPPESHILTTRVVKDEVEMSKKERNENDENEKGKEIDKLKAESVQSIEHDTIKQPIKFVSPIPKPRPQSAERPAASPFIADTKPKSAVLVPNQAIKNTNSSSSSPMRQPPINTSELQKGVQEDGKSNTSANADLANLSPVRVASDTTPSIPTSQTVNTPTSTTVSQPNNISSAVASQLSSVDTSHEDKDKQTESPLPKPELDQTEIGEKLDQESNILRKPSEDENSAMTISSPGSTSITPDKDTQTNTDIQPALAEAIQPVTEVKEQKEEQQIVPVHEKDNEQQQSSLDLNTTTLTSPSLHESETEYTPSNLTPSNPEQNYQSAFYDESRTRADEIQTESVDSELDHYLTNLFLAGMKVWQAWFNMYNELIATGIDISLNWFELTWKFLMIAPITTKEMADNPQ
jgi:hypothetical protein